MYLIILWIWLLFHYSDIMLVFVSKHDLCIIIEYIVICSFITLVIIWNGFSLEN